MNLRVLEGELLPGEDIPLELQIANVPNKDVTYKIELIDPYTRETISDVGDTVSIERAMKRIIAVPSRFRLKPARYILQGTASYTNEAGETISTEDVATVLIVAPGFLNYVAIPLWLLILAAIFALTYYVLSKTDFIFKHKKTATLVFYDQLSHDISGMKKLVARDFRRNKVLFVESREFFKRKMESIEKTEADKTYNRIILFVIRMRDFAKELSAKGFDVHYYKSDNFADAVTSFVQDNKIEKLYISHSMDGDLQRITRDLVFRVPTNVEII